MNPDSSDDELSNQPSTSRATTPIKKRKIRNEGEAPKQKLYAQKFKTEWLEIPQFKGWLKSIPENKFLCMCHACNAELKCGKSDLEKHAATAKHKKNVTKIQGLQTVTTFFAKNTLQSRAIAEAEIKLSNFFAQHNVAFQIVEHLIPLLKDAIKDINTLKEISLGRTKTVNIIKNVIAQKEIQDLSNELQQKYFSVLIDESTDISTNKLLCVVVKYVDNLGRISDRLLELITVDSTNCNAENLFIAFKKCLESKNIPLQNVVGFASDNASVMLGKNNSFMTRLRSETKALIVIPCICHSSALVANNACTKLPRTPEEFVRSVASYFSVSAKRTAQLAEMQEFFNIEQRKMLKLSATRWLSMQHAVKRIVDNWEVLLNYFRLANFEENSKMTNFIFQELTNNSTKAILLFLNYILNLFNTFNALFQSKKILIHELSSESRKLFKNIISHFIKPEYANDLKINCNNPRNHLDIQSIDLGVECNSFIGDLPEEIQISIRKPCLEFLATAATDLQSRLPLTDPFFDSLKFLKPEIALNQVKPVNLTSLANISDKFQSLDGIDKSKIDAEWKKIAIHFTEHEDQKLLFSKYTIEEFWHPLKNYKNFQDEYEFLNIAGLAILCMSLPHSNAETERVFSVVTDVKSKKRNKLGSEALNAVSVIRYSKRDNNNCCQAFNVTDEHVKLMASKNLYK